MTRRGFFACLAAVAALPLVPFRKPKPEPSGGFLIPKHIDMEALLSELEKKGVLYGKSRPIIVDYEIRESA